MAGVSRDNDTAGGDLIPSQTTVFANNEEVIVDNDDVAGHGGGPHAAPTIPAGKQSKVFANNKLVVIAGDDATCGHLSSGSGDVFIDNLFNVAINITAEHEAYLRSGVATSLPENELLEYGDGGIPNGDGQFQSGNTSPVNGVTGPQESATGNADAPSTFERASNPQLNFLPHTDPRIRPELKNALIRLAQSWGQTLTITSAYRSPEYNLKVGGKDKSEHKNGKAVDVTMTGYSNSDRARFIESAINSGLTGIGVYDTFIHVDIGGKRAWGSNGSRTSLPRYPYAQTVLAKYGYATR